MEAKKLLASNEESTTDNKETIVKKLPSPQQTSDPDSTS